MRHVTAKEFECPCCDENLIDMRLVNRLNTVRDRASTPVVINSGYRCPEHNRAVGSTIPDSAHVKGLAADISTPGSSDRFKILGALIHNGFTRIGVYKTFIHCDIDETKPQGVIWYG